MQSLKKNWLVVSNMTSGIWWIFTQSFTLMAYSCPKYMRFELGKIQRLYLSWHWTVVQSLKKPNLVVSEMAWGIGWTLIIKAPKSLKIVLWWVLFVQSIYCFSQKLSEELCVMTQKGVAKFKWKLPCGMKNDIRNSMVHFYASSWKSKNLHFDWILLSKVYKYLDKKVRKSYVSWHWRVMQILKKIWLLVPKMTQGIRWILMRAVASLEICTLMCYFCQCI